MPRIELTYAIAMAAAQDAGNRHMRAGGRTVWAVSDWNEACRTFAGLREERQEMPDRSKAAPEGESSLSGLE